MPPAGRPAVSVAVSEAEPMTTPAHPLGYRRSPPAVLRLSPLPPLLRLIAWPAVEGEMVSVPVPDTLPPKLSVSPVMARLASCHRRWPRQTPCRPFHR